MFSFKSMYKVNKILWCRSNDVFGEAFGDVIGGQSRAWGMPQLELLHKSRKKEVELLVCQGLAQTDSPTYSEWNYSLMNLEVAIIIQESIRFELVWVRKIFWIIHYVVETSKNSGVLRYHIIPHFEVSHCSVWNARTDER